MSRYCVQPQDSDQRDSHVIRFDTERRINMEFTTSPFHNFTRSQLHNFSATTERSEKTGLGCALGLRNLKWPSHLRNPEPGATNVRSEPAGPGSRLVG